MAGQAGYKSKLQISKDSGTTWLDMPATSPTMESAGDVLDTTELATTAGFRTRINGLHDFSGFQVDGLKRARTGCDAGVRRSRSPVMVHVAAPNHALDNKHVHTKTPYSY